MVQTETGLGFAELKEEGVILVDEVRGQEVECLQRHDSLVDPLRVPEEFFLFQLCCVLFRRFRITQLKGFGFRKDVICLKRGLIVLK